MSSATSPSPRHTNTNTIRPNPPFTYNYDTTRNDSFASYLALVRHNFTTPHQFPITPSHQPLHINLTRKRSDDDTEIDIFSADKYFNNPSPNSATPTPSNSLPCTLSQTSCAHSTQTQTTANSRNALLPHPRRRMFHLGGLGLWCSSCARNHAVAVDKAKDQSGSTVSSSADFIEQKQSVKQSPVSWRIETSSPATWPSSQRRRKPPPPLPPPPAKFFEKEEDDRSESSSDLFEIESVGVSRAGYEPSEASIAWSVVTASAANVSVVSDRSEEIGRGRRRSSGLLRVGCTSHKAVEVSSPVAAAEVGSSISPVVARYHVDLEVGGGSGRIVAGRANGTSWHGGSGRIIV